jgi:hypothetical protein
MAVVCLPSFSTDRAVTAAAFDPALSAAGGLRRCYLDLPGGGSGGEEPGRLDDVPPRLRDRPAVLTASAPGDEAYRERLRATPGTGGTAACPA